MKYKLPLAVPAGKHIYITQPYGRTYLTNEPVGPNGEPHFHYGSDIALGTPEETYGAAIVCPFPSAVVEKSITCKRPCRKFELGSDDFA